MEPDRRLELVMAEALRALNHQQSLLDNLRSRATLLTTAAALVGTLVGAPAIAHGHLGWPAGVGLAALVGLVACTFEICAPWWQWRFRGSARTLLSAMDGGHDLDSIRRNLAINFEDWLDANEVRIRKLQWWFLVGLGLLITELIGWAIQFRSRSTKSATAAHPANGQPGVLGEEARAAPSEPVPWKDPVKPSPGYRPEFPRSPVEGRRSHPLGCG